VQRRARHEIEAVRDGLEAERRPVAAKQTEDGDGAGDGGHCPDAGGLAILHFVPVQLVPLLYTSPFLNHNPAVARSEHLF